MALDAGAIFVKLRLDTKGFVNSIKKAIATTKSFVGKFGKVGTGIAAVGAAAGAAAIAIGAVLVVALVKGVKAAATFEKTMANVSTLISGDSTEAINDLRKGILEMTKVVPISADELGAASYDIVSAGIKGAAEQLDVLKNSAKLGVAGLSTTGEAVKVMTGAINAFGLESSDSARIADVLFKTVKNGINTVSDITASFGITSSIVAAAGISLEEFSAATAALTTTTTTASVAQTRLQQATLALQAPNTAMSEIFQKAGIESGALALEQDGLVATMVRVNDAADGNVEVLKKAFGSTEALGAATALTGEQNEAFTSTLLDMTEGANAVDEAFRKQMETYEESKKILLNYMNVGLIKLGSIVLPILIKAVKFVIDAFERFKKETGDSNTVIGAFIKLIKDTVGPQLQELKRIFDEELKPAIEENKELFKNIGLVLGAILLAAIGLVVAAFMILVGVVKIVIRIFVVAMDIINFLIKVSNKLRDVMIGGFNLMKDSAESFGRIIGDVIFKAINKFNEMKQPIQNIIDIIFSLVDAASNLGGLGDIVGGAKNAIFGDRFADGVTNFRGGVALVGEEGPEIVNLPRGSDVIPNDEITGAGSSINIGNVTINKDTDIDVFAQRLSLAMRLA